MSKRPMVYLVGTFESLKTNQWNAMCASDAAAQEYKTEHGLDIVKAVEVKPKGQPRRRKGNR